MIDKPANLLQRLHVSLLRIFFQMAINQLIATLDIPHNFIIALK